ncbi:MAG TPA: hypothetical protein VGZ23_02750 [bacterium]|nr:hypothetical protein [bacterium]
MTGGYSCETPVHVFDMARFLFGEAAEVQGWARRSVYAEPDAFVLLVRFERAAFTGGARVQVDAIGCTAMPFVQKWGNVAEDRLFIDAALGERPPGCIRDRRLSGHRTGRSRIPRRAGVPPGPPAPSRAGRRLRRQGCARARRLAHRRPGK